MKEELVKFETALLAREKGFAVETVSHFKHKEDYSIVKSSVGNYQNWNFFRGKPRRLTTSRPTQSLLQKWLREVHKIHVEVKFTDNTILNYYEVNVLSSKDREFNDEDFTDSAKRIFIEGGYKTYEEALEIGLQETLKLIKD